MMNVEARVIAAGYTILSLPRGEQKRYNRRVKFWQISPAILAALFVSIASADDFKTINGKEHKSVTWTKIFNAIMERLVSERLQSGNGAHSEATSGTPIKRAD